MVSKKLIAVFLILTIIPAGLLSWLGIMSIRAEKEQAKAQFAVLANERLERVNLVIESVFSDITSHLIQISDETTADIDSIREYTRNDRYIRQIFLLDEDGRLVFPSEAVPLSEQEHDFLARTKEIGLSAGLFLGHSGDETGPVEGEAETSNRSRAHGWHTWYLGEGVNFIFWKEKSLSGIIGFELNRMAVIADIINTLPDTGPLSGLEISHDFLFRIVLRDITDNVVYQWGGHSPAEGERPVAVVPVEEPLDAWRIAYYAPPDVFERGRGSLFPVLASLIVVLGGIIGLAVYLYRESTREIREAMERVSFVNQVSHELKTPLTNIRMYAELLEDRVSEDDEKAGSYVDVLISESRRLSRLIGNVLTFAKEQKSGLKLNCTQAVVDDTVRTVVDTFRPALEMKEFTIELDLNAGKTVWIDPDIIEQIVSNCISNVEKYAISGRYLRIETKGEAEITILIKDKGPGIPPSQRERVFKPFYRVSNKLTDGVTGTGIGLAIVRTLAELHGGEVTILPSNEGSLFQVILAIYGGKEDDDSFS